jgi:hypothetical protein
MKLYNLYQNVILEDIIRLTQLNEDVSPNDVDGVLNGDNGKFYHVSFLYKDEKGNLSNRWVQLYQRNISTANNGLIDAFQVSRDGKTSGLNSRTGKEENFTGWRKFRLDRISEFKVSKVPFYQPQGGFNKTGNNSPTVQSTQKIASVGSYQYADSTLKNNKNVGKRVQKLNKPEPEVKKPMVNKLNKKQPVPQQPMVNKINKNEPIVPPQQNNQQPEMDDDLENKDELNK